ncbi:allantoinase AllB [Halalkalibacter wakoensis]|uniref:allantoinase AllB n=1 Tax=Halalkalibacter wakoensis TaxID=127891 RepID=UPI0005505D67|nr:allantoinase AllB [Halalkalibacter wakoensis]
MEWDLVVKNGTIVSNADLYKGSVYIKDGKIVAITSEPLMGETKKVIDASGQYVFSGFIDTHIHSRDPGATHKEDFYYSTKAAAAGGVTTVFEMPNTNPPINHASNYYSQVDHLKSKAWVDFGVWGISLGPVNLHELQGLHEAGVIGFKFFWGYAIHAKSYQLMYHYEDNMEEVIPPLNDGEVFDIFSEVSKTGNILAIHAENHDIIQQFTKKAKQSAGRSYEDFLNSRPNLAEELTIQTGIAMAKKTGARLHILHVSTAEGVALIRQAQKEGYHITAETCPHYLFLTNEDYERIGTSMKVYPLVKRKKDQDALWEGIKDRTLSLVCSDHAPHTEEEKEGDLWSIPAGMCGVETLVPLMLDAVNKGKIELVDLAFLLSESPAKLFGIDKQKGSIQVGKDADLTIVDKDLEYTLKRSDLHSKSKVTAFDGFHLKGKPTATIVRGNIVMLHGEILEKPIGQHVCPFNEGE